MEIYTMLNIKNIDQAKKITQALFSFTKKNKTNLSQFRSFFASQFGFNELQDAFNAEHKVNEAHKNYLKENYITIFDDPRITIEVARKIEDEKDAENFLANLQVDKNIKFPITDSSELLKRCEEISILFNETDFYSQHSLFLALLKMSFNQQRLSYEKEEFSIAFEYIKNIKSSHSQMAEYFLKLSGVTDEDFDYDNGFSVLIEKLTCSCNMLTWTKSHCGSFVYNEATKNNDLY